MSEFLFLYRNSPAAREAAMGTPEQRQKSMQRWMAWMRDLEGKGHLKNAGQPLDRSGSLRSDPRDGVRMSLQRSTSSLPPVCGTLSRA